MNVGLIVFVLGVFSFLATPLTEAQPVRAYRIGFLSVASSSSMAPRVDAFRQGLRELGYVEGQNITIEYRWGDGRNEQLASLAAELIRLKVGMVVSHGVAATGAAQKASATIPIVCFGCGDLVAAGLVASLARPGGNVTGQTNLASDMTGKRLHLLKETIPGLTRLAILWNPDNSASVSEVKETEAAARSLGLQLQSLGVRDPDGFESAFSSMTKARADALLVLSDAMLFGQRKRIADLAATNRLPAISWTGEFAKSGGLMGYGPDLLAMSHRAATFVDRILKGAKPADLPIEQPTRFEFVVNLKTARALGLTIPKSILLRADDVIE
jgi:putative tryptophan/tyrosine transport system substrate-binding protein